MGVEEKSVIVEFFGSSPLVRILDFLVENRGFDYSKTDISRGADVSWGAIYAVWPKIESLGLVTPTRRFGRTVLYKLNERNRFVKRLLDLELDLIKLYSKVESKEFRRESALVPA